MFDTIEDLLLRGFSEETESDEKSIRNLKLEARGAQFHKAVNELLVKWSRTLLLDCATDQQRMFHQAMVVSLLEIEKKLGSEMKGER